ncbi:ATP-binding protein [Rhodococcus sp. MEB041]|uniref:ATP-binding protein n=1 Tax=Rhodococcus sp. MEB041 TaxID=3040323 RepID=UPI00254A1BED|nr:ATP-binding protein [Rhodococcus sp. MEB041]
MAMMGDHTTHELVPAKLAIQAMRDNGYRNAAYALAELIDNAVQAGATVVDLLCLEKTGMVEQRNRRNIAAIGVLDNGSGMEPGVLRLALQFGNGTHLDDRSGMGRFGMGLPSASISQCRYVGVWSWTDGPSSAHFSYIDLLKVMSGEVHDVPEPVAREVPSEWRDISRNFASTGTLVVWQDLDKCMWRTSNTIIRNSEFVIARMYRNFLSNNDLTIRMASFDEENLKEPTIEKFARANDPNYLMVPSSTPEPYGDLPMFERDGNNWEVTRKIQLRGETHEMKIKFTIASDAARSPANAGSLPYGKHAAQNIGVSLVRAGRELNLDQSLTIKYDPRERWWGIEIDFPPALDELFGVTNNKQSARNFSDVAESYESSKAAAGWKEYRQSLEDDDDPMVPLLDIVELIDKRLKLTRKVIEIQKKGSGKSRHDRDASSAEIIGTEATRARQQLGQQGSSDHGELRPAIEREQELSAELVDTGLSKEAADTIAAKTIDMGIKYTFADTPLEGRSFFTVKAVAGEIMIKLNVNHPAYKNLYEVLDRELESDTNLDALRARLTKASTGLKLLLMAWARLEDEEENDTLLAELQDYRSKWGAVAYKFLQTE